ncbi:MAG: hemin uptake protein HemP [Pseudomonadota bacterium]|jgi:hemin uptake protein HemP
MKPELTRSAPPLVTQPDARARLPDPIPADRLFEGRQEIQIAHGDEIYRLRITRNGKLILTK